MSLNSIIHCSSGFFRFFVLKKKNAFKSIFKKISGYTKVKVTLCVCVCLIFVIGLSVSLGDFSNRFLKCSFHMCIRSSWLEVLFLLLTSFAVCHANKDYPLRNFYFYWSDLECILSFWYAFIKVFWAFLSFLAWHQLGSFYYIGMLFSRCLVFFPIAYVSHGTLCLAPCFVGMHSSTASKNY